MTFRVSWALWFLALVPVVVALLVYGYRARKQSVLKFGDPRTVELLVHKRSPQIRATRGVLFVVGFGLFLLAFAGPQYGSHTRVLRKRGIDVVIALDFSKSMLAKDVRPSRIDRAKAELSRLFSELTGDRVGVVAFAGDTMEFPMTTDYAAIETFLRDLGPYDMPVGGTAIGRALTASGRILERARKGSQEAKPDTPDPERRSQVVLLFTDGEDHEGDPVEAARALAAEGARVFVVGIGSKTGEPIPTYAPDGTWTGYLRDDSGNPVLSALTDQNEAQLRKIAEIGKGKYFRAREGTVGVDEIRTLMHGMKQSENKARKITIAEDRYALVLLPAFLLLLLEALLPDAWQAGFPWRRARTRAPEPAPPAGKKPRRSRRERKEQPS
jgi:Ca-activated chloride channel family protein